MKIYLTILSVLLFFTNQAYAVKKSYITYPTNTFNRAIYRPVYNPWGIRNNTRNNRYYNRRYYPSYNDIRRIQRLNRIRRWNNTIRNGYYNNCLSWFNRNNRGTLTGYSLPINKNAYTNTGIIPYNQDPKQKYSSPNCKTDLFSAPTGNEMYYTNGELIKDIRNSSGKAGVTIIYD